MLTKTESMDFSLSECLLNKLPQYAELEIRKTRTNMPCIPFKSKYIERKGTQEVTWLAIWLDPEHQYATQYTTSLLQNSLNLNIEAIAVLPDGYIVRKPYQWDCLISKDKEFVKTMLPEVYRITLSEEGIKEILEEG